MKMIELPFWRRQSWRIRKKGHPFLLVNPFNKFCTVFLIRYDQFPLRLLLQEVRCYSRKLTKATQSTSNLRRFHLFRDTLIEARRRKKPTEVELSAPPKDCRATSHILQPPILPPQRSASRTSTKSCGGIFGLIPSTSSFYLPFSTLSMASAVYYHVTVGQQAEKKVTFDIFDESLHPLYIVGFSTLFFLLTIIFFIPSLSPFGEERQAKRRH